MEEKRFKDALPLLNALNKKYLNKVNRAWRYLLAVYKAHVHHKLQQYEDAVEYFDKALEAHPRAHNALFMRARSKEGLGDWVGALRDYESVLDINPNIADAYSGIGFLLEFSGDTQRSIQYYKKALTLDPTDALAKKRMAHLDQNGCD